MSYTVNHWINGASRVSNTGRSGNIFDPATGEKIGNVPYADKNEVNEAADRIIGGIAGSAMEDTKNKKLIAYQEVGRAIVSAVKNGIDSVDKITILPRSGYVGGYTKINPDEDIVSSGLI